MKLGFPTQIAWIVIVSCMAFVFALTITGNEIATRLENYIGFALSIACMLQYRHESWRALMSRQPTNVQVLSLGIFVYWVGNNIRNIYSSLDRDFNIPWLRFGPVVPFFLFLMILSGALHRIGPHVRDGHVGRKTIIDLFAVVGVGAALALIVTAVVDWT